MTATDNKRRKARARRRLRCSNCGNVWVLHCAIHATPCCPGKCPGRKGAS